MSDSEWPAAEQVLRQADDELTADLNARTDVEGMLALVMQRANDRSVGKPARPHGASSAVAAHHEQPGMGAADADEVAEALILQAGRTPAGSQPARMEQAGRHGRAAPPVGRVRSSTLAEVGDLLRALAAPVRIAIVLQLRAGGLGIDELANELAVSQPLLSQHLRVLKSAGVVHGERHGRDVVYRLANEHVAHIVVDAVTHAEETESKSPRAGQEDGQASLSYSTTSPARLGQQAGQ